MSYNAHNQLSHVTPPPPAQGLDLGTILSPLSHGSVIYSTPHAQTENEDEILAIDALNQMKNSGNSTPALEQRQLFADNASTSSPPLQSESQVNEEITSHTNDDEDEDEYISDSSNDSNSIYSDASSRRSSSTRLRLYNKVRNIPIVNTAVLAYKEHKPAIKYGVEMVEQAAMPVVEIYKHHKRKRRLRKANAMFPDDAKVDISSISSSSFTSSSSSASKRQKLPSISEALAMDNMNWNDISNSMSIESKKRMQTCLQLLMLANKQLTSKVQHLQDIIAKEQDILNSKSQEKRSTSPTADDENEVYHDATEDVDDNGSSAIIKQEIVGTIKKVVTFISKYAGTSLPEPQRTDVREELLRLPSKWSSSTSSSVLGYNTNAKVLVLANESLEMVRSVMSTFDDTLNMADLWVKQKQEKQLAKQAILNNSFQRRQVASTSSASMSGMTSVPPLEPPQEASNHLPELDADDKELIED